MLGWGSNPCLSSSLSCCRENNRSLTHCTTAGTPDKSSCITPSKIKFKLRMIKCLCVIQSHATFLSQTSSTVLGEESCLHVFRSSSLHVKAPSYPSINSHPIVVGSILGRIDTEKRHRALAIWAENSWVPVIWTMDPRTYSARRGTSREESQHQTEWDSASGCALSSVTIFFNSSILHFSHLQSAEDAKIITALWILNDFMSYSRIP